MAKLIFKIVARSAWRQALEDGRFDGAPIDIKDGFIHFSTAEQVAETASLHFAGQEDLLLVAIDGDELGDALKYEPSRGGDLFPHLYSTLPLELVRWAHPMPLDSDGNHILPDLDQ
ncbi:DUF952 domain-containing protein [Hoeflea sp.]|uniref:DUF952 domain-containing protein n=1 Tax=Hoeflea sp. TaxID=1940281 RepID=UPI003B01B84B